MDLWTTTGSIPSLRVALPDTPVGDERVGWVDEELEHPDWFGLVIENGSDDVAVLEGPLHELARELASTLRVLHDLVKARERAAKQGKENDAQTLTLLVPNGRRERLIVAEGVSR